MFDQSTQHKVPQHGGQHVPDPGEPLDLPHSPGMYGTPFDDEGLPIFAPGASMPVSFIPELDDDEPSYEPDGSEDYYRALQELGR